MPARAHLCESYRKAGLAQRLLHGCQLERQIGAVSQPTTSNSKGLRPFNQSEKSLGLTVHYNTMRPFSRGYDYGADPALNLSKLPPRR